VKEKVLNIAEQIVDRARAINKASVNVFVYSKLLQGYCSSNQRKEAFALLAVCTCPSIEITFGTLIVYPRSCCTPQTSNLPDENVHCLVTGSPRSSTDIYSLFCKHLKYFLDSGIGIPLYYSQRDGVSTFHVRVYFLFCFQNMLSHARQTYEIIIVLSA
jgi:hypothetical protein